MTRKISNTVMSRNFNFYTVASVFCPEPIEGLRTEEYAIGMCEAVLEFMPHDIPTLTTAGHLYTSTGRYEEGLKVDLALYEILSEDAVVNYNLACSYALLERIEEALGALSRAVDFGFVDVESLLDDTDLDNIRGEERFDAIVDAAAVKKKKQLRGDTD